MESSKRTRFENFWLAVPWLVVAAIFAVETSGLKVWFLSTLPAMISGIVQWDFGWEIAGAALVTYFSSVRWSYTRLRDRSNAGALFGVEVAVVALIVTAAQVYAMAAVFFAGCVVLM